MVFRHKDCPSRKKTWTLPGFRHRVTTVRALVTYKPIFLEVRLLLFAFLIVGNRGAFFLVTVAL